MGLALFRNLVDPGIISLFFEIGQARYNALRNHQSEYVTSKIDSPYQKFVTDREYNTFTIPFLEPDNKKFKFLEEVAKTQTLQIF